MNIYIHAVLFVTIKRQKELNCPSTNEWKAYTKKFYLAIKRNEALIHTTTWMNPENMLNERSQSQKTTCYMIQFL